MNKILRSLIHEMFPFDLRVQIELLSRRRDLMNQEKHDELILLLRKSGIDNIVQLGPGTNRYALKLNGFVVKFATDIAGKIDNMKEFKMAKRLYPYVIRVHEVSENGTIMVCEYIQPFTSFSEMVDYSNKITSILNEMSSVYLIGDVGISENNYSNWGLRIGSDDPVCLDFAYVYEVSSNLFICKKCGSILSPTKDFTGLHCSSLTCGEKESFASIRSKLADDIHMNEIGNLSDEGYILTESNVSTVLDINRSNYLSEASNKKVTHQSKIKKEPEIQLDNFVMPHPPEWYIKNRRN